MTKKTKYVGKCSCKDINTATDSAANFVVFGDGYWVLNGKEQPNHFVH